MGDLLGGGDCDENFKFTINENYASKYSRWREKEVFQKLKDRYGADANESELSTSEDDEDAKDLPKVEKSFFRVLSFVKKKDPRIYDENEKYYPDLTPSSSTKNNERENKFHKNKRKDKPFLLKDYERKIILEKEGKLSEDDSDKEDPRASSPTYIEEQKAIKDSFKTVFDNSDDDENEGFGVLLKRKTKTEAQQKKEEEDYKEWLTGRKNELDDKNTETDLKVLRDYWTDPNLSSDEIYLRDYILNRRFLDPEDDDFKPSFNEVVHDDDDLDKDLKYVDDQESFEKKYNFRFEEPDSEFIKRYPRNVETSLRRTDDRRKIKRQEVRERKEAEKITKREEIKQLKALKKKEILEKIEKIKQITGNSDLDFKDEDFENDFSPEQHDQKMQELFNDDYYGVEETVKPECPELEEDLEIEDWENWRGKDYDSGHAAQETWEPQCEDPNFNMDCDYDPKAQLQEELISISKSKKKEKRKSKFAQALAKEKPIFDPSNKKFEEYFEEYYKLDCEDIIDDLPCRFKYRTTTPNDYGLTVDEILRADVKELNKWCSLKKIVNYKPDHVEEYELKAYKQKANNEALKRKILPSLYSSISDEQNFGGDIEAMRDQNGNKQKLKRKYNEAQQDSNKEYKFVRNEVPSHFGAQKTEDHNFNKRKGKKAKYQEYHEDEMQLANSVKKQEQNINGFSVDSTNGKRKKQFRKEVDSVGSNETELTVQKQAKNALHNSSGSPGKRRKNLSASNTNLHLHGDGGHPKEFIHKIKDERKQKSQNNFSTSKSNLSIPISDVRLKAYGIHPKKFKNKIKYGNQQNAWVIDQQS